MIVLVVDDSPVVIAVVRAVLGHAGHTVVDANDLASALVRCREHGPEAVLLDVMLPGVGADALPAALLALTEAGVGRVVLFTGLAASELPAADGYVRKPFAPAELIAAVELRGAA